jgi:hypothetical protein
MKVRFSSPRNPKIRRFFKRSPMDTGYDDWLPDEQDMNCFSDKNGFLAGIDDFLAK